MIFRCPLDFGEIDAVIPFFRAWEPIKLFQPPFKQLANTTYIKFQIVPRSDLLAAWTWSKARKMWSVGDDLLRVMFLASLAIHFVRRCSWVRLLSLISSINLSHFPFVTILQTRYRFRNTDGWTLDQSNLTRTHPRHISTKTYAISSHVMASQA